MIALKGLSNRWESLEGIHNRVKHEFMYFLFNKVLANKTTHRKRLSTTTDRQAKA